MTNAEKFMTATERAKAYREYCEKVNNPVCVLLPFHWLEQEAEEEKPLPCPFCGGESKVYTVNGMYYIKCSNYNCKVSVWTIAHESKHGVIATWNRRVR